MMHDSHALPSSFRDPSGFLFKQDNRLLRQVNQTYAEHYDDLMTSGLYAKLVEERLLIPHEEVSEDLALMPTGAYKVIEPEIVKYISYPYEWSFQQLKDAALLTLRIQNIALQYGMVLKDATAYNVQFHKGKPIWIDTLSFEKYTDGSPWVAYGQFCRHFYAPLALMSKTDIRLSQLLRVYIDGIPIELASNLLSWKTYFHFSILGHIHIHSKYQKRYEQAELNVLKNTANMKKGNLVALINSLQTSINNLKWKTTVTEWGDYYSDTNYSSEGMEDKIHTVQLWIRQSQPVHVWDLGGNVGVFSRLASSLGIPTLCFDMDPAAVNKNYLQTRQSNEVNLLPLVLDLTNPSSSLGWNHQERLSFADRGPADMVLALALMHHLVISNHISFDKLSEFFSGKCRILLIEFIPKHDSQVQRLLASREDVFIDYSEESFITSFLTHFEIIDTHKLRSSERTLYLMRSRSNER